VALTKKKNPMKRELLSMHRYAHRRGCAPSTVGRAVRLGRLKESVVKRGKRILIDPEIADQEWEKNTRMHIIDSLKEKTANEQRQEQRREDPPVLLDYQEARAKKIRADAAASEIKLQKLRGDLIDVLDVARLWEEVLGSLRRRLEVIPDRLASELVAIDDPKEMRDRLRADIRAALQDAANELTNASD